MSAWAEVPTLTGAHVTLRPLARNDRDALVTVASTEGLWDIFYANVSQLKDADRWLDAAFQQQDVGRARLFAVCDPTGQLVGTTRYMRMSAAHRRLEIGGTFYAKAVQRTGVNTGTKSLLLTHAFEALGCQCVQIRTDFLNTRSQAAIERLGAKRDGILRGHQIVDGRLRDTVVYSIIDREWPGVKQNLAYLLGKYA